VLCDPTQFPRGRWGRLILGRQDADANCRVHDAGVHPAVTYLRDARGVALRTARDHGCSVRPPGYVVIVDTVVIGQSRPRLPTCRHVLAASSPSPCPGRSTSVQGTRKGVVELADLIPRQQIRRRFRCKRRGCACRPISQRPPLLRPASSHWMGPGSSPPSPPDRQAGRSRLEDRRSVMPADCVPQVSSPSARPYQARAALWSESLRGAARAADGLARSSADHLPGSRASVLTCAGNRAPSLGQALRLPRGVPREKLDRGSRCCRHRAYVRRAPLMALARFPIIVPGCTSWQKVLDQRAGVQLATCQPSNNKTKAPLHPESATTSLLLDAPGLAGAVCAFYQRDPHESSITLDRRVSSFSHTSTAPHARTAKLPLRRFR